MIGLIRKPLFWTNLAVLVFAGWLIAGLVFGFNNPGQPPPNGSGAIQVDGSGNVGVSISPNASYRLNVNGWINGTTGLCINADCRSSWPSGISGGGTVNYLSKFTSSGVIGNSLIQDNGSNIGIAMPPTNSERLAVSGFVRGTSGLCISADCRTNWPVAAGGINCGAGNVLQGINANGAPICVASGGSSSSYPITNTATGGAISFSYRILTDYPGLTYSYSSTQQENNVSVRVNFGTPTGSCISGRTAYNFYLYDGATLISGPVVGPTWPAGPYTYTFPTFSRVAGSHTLQIKMYVDPNSGCSSGSTMNWTAGSSSMTTTRNP